MTAAIMAAGITALSPICIKVPSPLVTFPPTLSIFSPIAPVIFAILPINDFLILLVIPDILEDAPLVSPLKLDQKFWPTLPGLIAPVIH